MLNSRVCITQYMEETFVNHFYAYIKSELYQERKPSPSGATTSLQGGGHHLNLPRTSLTLLNLNLTVLFSSPAHSNIEIFINLVSLGDNYSKSIWCQPQVKVCAYSENSAHLDWQTQDTSTHLVS